MGCPGGMPSPPRLQLPPLPQTVIRTTWRAINGWALCREVWGLVAAQERGLPFSEPGPAHRSKGEWVKLAESLEGAQSFHGQGLNTTEGHLEGKAVVATTPA